ncbi:hypothetical protein MHIP_12170 [Mycolicibacterium hippocampi]|uniref:Uncharacterized protein n=1 Tax=Mycolicibacterium hippocampi TaxID=659824 RepID=A0A7I9ZIE9_9MYCO|nr:hypothetical protein MHIP_12170 [Mycolicibacterium hippocampi]
MELWDGTAIATRVSERNASDNRHPTPLAKGIISGCRGHLGGTTAAQQELMEVANKRKTISGESIV